MILRMLVFLSLDLGLLCAQTQFGIVYSQATGRIRSIIKPDKNSDLAGIQLGTGEARLVTSNLNYGDLATVQSFLNTQTGLIPINDRYAIINIATGNVMGAIIADPLCGDSIAGSLLLPHPTAGEGWHWDVITGFVDLRPVIPVIKPIVRLFRIQAKR